MIDLSGKIYGSFLVLKEGERRIYKGRPTHRYWTCLCKKCGQQKDVFQGSLIHRKSLSCGCWRSDDTTNKNKTRRNRTPKHPEGVSGFNRLYASYRRAGLKRGFEFLISIDEFKYITSKNCFYCNAKPTQIAATYSKYKDSRGEINSRYFYNGIDRINNDQGYFLNNCLPCCGICNKAKSNRDFNEFIEWANRISEHQRIKKELLITVTAS